MKLFKKSDLKKIAKATGISLEDLEFEAAFANDADGEGMDKAIRVEFVLYLLSRETAAAAGICGNAREVFASIDRQMGNKWGTARTIALNETLGYHGHAHRFLVAELNMGLNHISNLPENPYAA